MVVLQMIDEKLKPIHLSPLSLLLLAACGGGGGGSGKTSEFFRFVVKGPLQNATIFADYDGDGIQDSNEPSAITNSMEVIHYLHLIHLQQWLSKQTPQQLILHLDQ